MSFLFFLIHSASSDDSVTVYDDFDNGAFGRSEFRSVTRSVRISAFSRYDSLGVKSSGRDEESFLTAVVLSKERERELKQGLYKEYISDHDGVYTYSRKGLEFSFSLEKPSKAILLVLEDYYKGSYSRWFDDVRNHYLNNFVIRIYKAENVFEPWKSEIQYSEALLMATLLGDSDQWLWGIYDGYDLLNH